MKLLLTSAGISNASIRNVLIELLGKPIAEANAVFVPTAIYGIRNGGDIVRRVICGSLGDPFCELGWKSLGLLELTALASIKRELWVPMLQETDALLVGGGDCQYLTYWMQQSGLAHLLPSLLHKMVYVGLSAGSMVTTRLEQPTVIILCRPKAISRWVGSILRFTLTWIMRRFRRVPWLTWKSWLQRYRCPPT